MKPAFGEFCDELLRTLHERFERYGSRNITGPAGLKSRLDDKMARIEHGVSQDGRPSLNDWMDTAGYAAIGYLEQSGKWDDREAKRRVYVAHAIGRDHKHSYNYREAIGMLADSGFAVYWPGGAFTNAKGHAEFVWRVNLEAIRCADLVLAFWQKDAAGVSAELLFARELKKTIWVVALDEPGSLVEYCASRIMNVNEFEDGVQEALLQEVSNHGR